MPTETSTQDRFGYFTQNPRVNTARARVPAVFTQTRYMNLDYRGEVKVILINHGQESFSIRRGDRIAQLVIAPVTHAITVEVARLGETGRGAGGFGSTGVSDAGPEVQADAFKGAVA